MLLVVGVNDSKKLLEDIPNKIVNYMGLVVDVNLYEQNGLDYIELIVNPSNVPISFKGKYYYRSGSTMQELNGAALQQFIMKKMGKSWDDISNENATLDDIDREAINYFLRKGIDANRIPEDERNASVKDVLTSLNLTLWQTLFQAPQPKYCRHHVQGRLYRYLGTWIQKNP